MFEINDGREKREELLDRIFNADPCAGFIIACMDFEWTVRRGIMALGQSTTMVIREKFHGGLKYNKVEQSGNSGIKNKQNDSVNHKFICGLKEYKQLWNFEVVDNNQKPAYLYNILNKKVKLEKIHGFDEKKFNEHYSKKRGTDAVSFLKDIYKNLRNPLVHGSRSHINDDSVAFAYHFMKACSRAIVEFVQNPVSLDEENTNNQKNNKKNHNNEFTVYKKLVRKKPRYTDETLKKNSTKKKKADKAAGNCQESE